MSRAIKVGSTPRTIVVVEDDPSIAMGLEMNLAAEGYVVRSAADGELGLVAVVDARQVRDVALDDVLPIIGGEANDDLAAETRRICRP
jgi:DNA-binding response OmpR family regulator